DYLAKIMLDGKQIFEATFKGVNDTRVVKNLSFDTDLKDFAKNKILPLNVSKEGRGVLYYTASLKYSLPSEMIKSRDEGFSVFSEITNLDGKVIDGKTLKLGETYKMKVVINTSKHRNFVALRCPVPSGAEILDSSFVTTQNIKRDQSSQNESDYDDAYSDYGYYDYYYDYGPVQKIYDNEVQYFFDDINSGAYEVEFIFRITTPGIFPTPPSYVECMYEDEVFGRNSGKVFVVNPK
nr:hypothetical protein [Spirochaetota bacterium]